MSCQQVSRIITTNATTLSTGTSISTPEDPYVFTETVPTTPPILFNTQKSRSRHSVIENNTQFIKTRTPSQKLPLAQLNRNVLKVNVPVSAEAITAGTGVNLKKASPPLPKSQQPTQQLQKNRITTNVCIVRPQLQQKQQKQQQQQQQQQQQLPVFTHTPSLWQTPLLLDTTPAVVTGNGNSNSSSPQISSTASLCSPRPVQTVIALPTLTTSTAPAAAAVSTTSINIGINNTTTTTSILSTTIPQTAMVSPLLNTSNSTLPPSKFHHTTLAHHLEKVQCIKKPKKATAHKQQQQQQQQLNTDAKVLVSESVPPPLQALCETKPTTGTVNSNATAAATTQHSDSSDLNEIPVNVIFRKPQSTNELTRTLLNATDGVTAADNDVTKNSNSFNTTNTTSTPAGNKMRNVKIIAPTQKCSLPSSVSTLLTQFPATTADSKLAGEKDVVFVQPLPQQQAPMQLSPRPTTETSSKLMSSTNNTNNVTMPALVLATTPQLNSKIEKSLQTDALYTSATSPPPLLKVSNGKRKFSKCTSPANTSQLQKKNRRIFASILNNERVSMNFGRGTSNTAVAVVKLSAAEVDADTSLLASATVLPYCLQKHWLHAGDKQKKVSSTRYLALVPNTQREDHIAQHKNLLRRQALQMLTTRSLQKLPLYAARRRLMSVDRLLRKYHKQHGDYDRLHKTCIANACKNRTMELASHCHQHIISNMTQQVFLPCTAKFADKQCCAPVFDISHDMPLCCEHARKRDAYNHNLIEQHELVATENIQQVQEHQQPQQKQQQQHNCYSDKKALSTTTAPARKRKLANGTIGNPVGRPQKRAKKLSPTAVPNVITEAEILPPLSAVLQRKSSTASLESIASNSYSSNSQPLTQPSAQQEQHQQQQQQSMLNPMGLSPPALAPLSGFSVGGGGGGVNGIGVASHLLNFGNSAAVAADLKEHEINDIVTQLMVAAHNNNSNSNGSHSSSSINNTNNHNNNNCNSINFANTNSNSNFTSSGLGSSSSLPSATDELLTQDMLSICENSSVYASSEDTGLGGLSETELMAGAPDADEIPLVDARFIFDDLANAISSMPADAYNELFTTVRQDEREDLERALEIADKHLKTLQQTIGSGSDFLDDFLDVNDDILPDTDICSKMDIVSSVMHSPETSNMESSSLFIDSISNGTNGTAGPTTSCPTAVDIRGLVQT